MYRNTMFAKAVQCETKYVANKADDSIGPVRNWIRNSLRNFDPHGRSLAHVSRYWNPMNRPHREDPPPAAAAVVL